MVDTVMICSHLCMCMDQG